MSAIDRRFFASIGSVVLMLAIFIGRPALARADGKQKQIAQYVVLEGGGPDQGPGRDVSANMKAMAERFGPMSPSSGRMLAYGVQQLRILSRSVEVVRQDVNEALDLAESTGIPVFLHVDSCYGWGADTEESPAEAPSIKFWQHPQMREWDCFPKDGQLPEKFPRGWLNWGPWCTPAPAVPAIGSAAFVELAQKQLDQGVLVPLAERLVEWRNNGKAHLFAGINIGWEVHIPDYGDPALLHLIQQSGVVHAEYPRSSRGVKMDEGFIGKQLGYASLHYRGWDEARLVAAAEAAGITREAKFRELCYESIHDYQEALAKSCHDRGIAASHVYTHIVAIATVENASTTRPPIWTAVNRYSTPGFTMDNRGAARYDLDNLLQQIREARGGDDRHFGMVESYFRLGGRRYRSTAAECEEELKALFNAGATVQVFYGGFPLASGRIPEPVFSALKQWQRGNGTNAKEQ